MCAVRGTKLYGLRIKKDSQIQNNYELNIFKIINFTLQRFGSGLCEKSLNLEIQFMARRVYFSLASSVFQSYQCVSII